MPICNIYVLDIYVTYVLHVNVSQESKNFSITVHVYKFHICYMYIEYVLEIRRTYMFHMCTAYIYMYI